MDDEMLGKLVNFVLFVNGEKRMSFFGTVETWTNTTWISRASRGYQIDGNHGNIKFKADEVSVIDSHIPEIQMYVVEVAEE